MTKQDKNRLLNIFRLLTCLALAYAGWVGDMNKIAAILAASEGIKATLGFSAIKSALIVEKTDA
jgi:hypothetical protein